MKECSFPFIGRNQGQHSKTSSLLLVHPANKIAFGELCAPSKLHDQVSIIKSRSIAGFQMNERYLNWDTAAQAQLLKLSCAAKLNLVSSFEASLQSICQAVFRLMAVSELKS